MAGACFDPPCNVALSRRQFLSTTIGTGAALATPGLRPPKPVRRDSVTGRSPLLTFDLEERTIAQLQDGMSSGATTASELTDRYLQRFAELDKAGPSLNAIIEVNPEAVSIAKALDAERRVKGPRSSLHGIPVLIKDNIATADRMRTSAGSLALAESTAARDAEVVQRLRAAGAVILGKTNLSEWANFRSSASVSGWSARGGLTRNPYVLDRNTCGSSSGSAAAVSSNLAAVAVGTETDGSIVCPASTCGIVGIKPTRGLVSCVDVIPISKTQDTVGPMARSVADAAALLGIMSGVDYSNALEVKDLQGVRLGIARSYFGFHQGVDRGMEGALQALREAGAVLVDPADPRTSHQLGDWEFEVLLYEFKAGLNDYLAGLGPSAPVQSLAQLIEFNDRHHEKEMRFFGQDLFLKAQAKGPLTDSAYRKALSSSGRGARHGLDQALRKHRVEALVAPTRAPAWVTDWVNGDPSGGGHASSLPAIAGYPHITVPAGFIHGLPYGISFIGGAHSEAILIRIAQVFEQSTQVRRKPTYQSSLVP
jgi:amidase